jgi:hypothetical protein
MLVHSVYFWLRPELTPAQRADFRAAVEKLGDIKVVEKIHVGTPAATPKRPVIDDTYSIALTVVLADLAAQDAYQIDPVHVEFVRRYQPSWTRVVIYDVN